MDEAKILGYAAAIVIALSGVVAFLFRILYNTLATQAERTQHELENEKGKREVSDAKLNNMEGRFTATIEAKSAIDSLPGQFDAMQASVLDAIKSHK